MRRYRTAVDGPLELERHLNTVTDIAEQYDGVLLPQWQAINSANILTPASNTPVFWYQQRLKKEIEQVEIHFRVTRAAVGLTWGELGVFVAPFSASRTAFSFYRLGWTSLAAELVAIGNYRKTITLGPTKPGMDIWFCFGAVWVTTSPQIRSTYGDELGFGYHQQSTGRPSLVSPFTGVLAAPAQVIPWMPYRIIR